MLIIWTAILFLWKITQKCNEDMDNNCSLSQTLVQTVAKSRVLNPSHENFQLIDFDSFLTSSHVFKVQGREFIWEWYITGRGGANASKAPSWNQIRACGCSLPLLPFLPHHKSSRKSWQSLPEVPGQENPFPCEPGWGIWSSGAAPCAGVDLQETCGVRAD